MGKWVAAHGGRMLKGHLGFVGGRGMSGILKEIRGLGIWLNDV